MGAWNLLLTRWTRIRRSGRGRRRRISVISSSILRTFSVNVSGGSETGGDIFGGCAEGVSRGCVNKFDIKCGDIV